MSNREEENIKYGKKYRLTADRTFTKQPPKIKPNIQSDEEKRLVNRKKRKRAKYEEKRGSQGEKKEQTEKGKEIERKRKTNRSGGEIK